ncbi:hypothetical protein [Thermomonas mangrovi]|uniref:hypothetical protein n=1 Tax=Thermomonas mangrovi TaxID=2993316 RepID=UPI00230724BA|nr:hypothetical protein [Thermomonas mangrovi]
MTLFSLLAGVAAVVALCLFALWRRIRRRPALFAAACWGAYAGWEALVQWRTPEANIRVDLLLFIPVLAISAAWALLAAWRARRGNPA